MAARRSLGMTHLEGALSFTDDRDGAGPRPRVPTRGVSAAHGCLLCLLVYAAPIYPYTLADEPSDRAQVSKDRIDAGWMAFVRTQPIFANRRPP